MSVYYHAKRNGFSFPLSQQTILVEESRTTFPIRLFLVRKVRCRRNR